MPLETEMNQQATTNRNRASPKYPASVPGTTWSQGSYPSAQSCLEMQFEAGARVPDAWCLDGLDGVKAVPARVAACRRQNAVSRRKQQLVTYREDFPAL
jgi:hypothetical protein